MRTRWFYLSLAGGAGLALLAAGGCGEQAAAITVGDSYVSQSDFMDEVRDIHAWEEERSSAFQPEPADTPADVDDGSFSQEYVGDIAAERVLHMLLVQLFEDQGLELTTADEAAACVGIVEQAGMAQAQATGDPCGTLLELQDLSGAPDWMQERIVQDQAMNYVLVENVDNAELQAASDELLATTKITVNSKYGTWDDSLFEAYLRGEPGASPVAPPQRPFTQFSDRPESPAAGADDSQLDPELMALLERYELDVTTLGPGGLDDLASQLEMMGMDPANLTPEDLAELELQIQMMQMGGGQPGAPTP